VLVSEAGECGSEEGPMTRINSRAKGATFERDIATDLRAWLGDGWTVTRTPTDRQRSQDKSGHAGEFTIVGPRAFPWAIECKNGAAFDLRQLWRSPVDGPLPKWWAQTMRQAATVGRRPLLVVKVARGETLAVLLTDPRHTTYQAMPLVLDGNTVAVLRWTDMQGDVVRVGARP
jgi:hypothetical protein